MVRADDGGDDVAAEGGADLPEQILVVAIAGMVAADAQVGAVGGEPGAQGAGDARRQVAAGRGGAVQHDLRLAHPDEPGEHAGVRLRQIGRQVGVVGGVDGVGAVGDEAWPQIGHPGATDNGAHLGAKQVGELARTAQQLQADFCRARVFHFDPDPDLGGCRDAAGAREGLREGLVSQGCVPRRARARVP